MSEPNKSAYAVVDTGQLSATGSVVHVRFKSNFSVQHMLTAARFARISGEIEARDREENAGEQFEEVISYVMASILTSSAGLEAYINELFIDNLIFFPEYQDDSTKELWSAFWKQTERNSSILEKYQIAVGLKKQNRFPKDHEIYRSADVLVQVRNERVHFKSQWDDEEKSHREVAKRLQKEGVRTSPFADSGIVFPNSFMSHDMARWAVKTSWQFIEAFSQRSCLDNKLNPFVERLNPGYPSWP